MLFKEVVQVVLATIVLWSRSTEAAPMASVKLCGRQLSEIMSRMCHSYNSPSWDVPTVVEQPGVVARRKRQLGIADECCLIGCTWEQLTEYCSISAYSESPLEEMESHVIADRSAESATAEAALPNDLGKARYDVGKASREVGKASHEVGKTRHEQGGRRNEVGRTRGRQLGRCWCRRRRSGRRRASLMGNMDLAKSVRAAPVVGTVSPLITWGRTLNTDLPTAPVDRDRYAYVIRT